jgi:hypothetical protein
MSGMTTPSDQDLWTAVVQAERELARRRADFHQHARDQTTILAQALRGGGWDASAALWYLREFYDGTPALLEPLVNAALSDRSALWARQAIARVSSDRLFPELERIVPAQLEDADDLDYRRLAELLVHVQAWTILHKLVLRALASDDADTREVGEDFTAWHGAWWTTPG